MHKLDYARPIPQRVHSRYGVASVFMAIAVILFSIAVGVFDLNPIQSMGNEKETSIAISAAVLGILLAVRGMADHDKRQVMAIWGLVLNMLAGLVALLLLPYI